jgi:enoyl-CoA hydratase/carnithine racemase
MKTVKFEKRDRIAYITLNRPDALNALNDQLNEELAQTWTDFCNDESVDLAILTGEGRAFCAGADLKSFIPKWESATTLDLRENAKQGLGGGITRGKHRIYKPIIAAINGLAVGAGFELALAADIRIASAQAKFGVFEVRFGLHQGDGGLVRLLAIAGLGVAMDLTLSGRQVSAEEAFQLRLIHKVVSPENLLSESEAYAKLVLANSQRALRSAKETLMDIIGRTFDDALRIETLNSYSCLGDFGEARARLQAAGFLK